MATIQDIADKLGVTKGTVSKALNGAEDISETLRKSILETAVEMGYTRQRRYKNSAKKLCIFVENLEYTQPHHFGYDIVIGFRQMAEPAGYVVDIIPVDEKLERSISYDVFMLQHDYVGAFALGFTLHDTWMNEFRTSKTPLVLYDNYIKANPTVAYIGADNNEGMELAVSHLKHLGHKKIGYLSSALGSHIMQVRHKAFFHAMRQNGLRADSDYVGASYYITQCLEKHLPRLLDMGMTAIICSHDTLANSAMVQCQQMGRHVPKDISIIGFDDLPICAYTSPPMTTVRQERTEIGKCGYYALDSLMNQVSIGTILIHTRLMVRESTGPAPGL
ncbi:LacI family DNA-binding transcriptional regulator [Sellimonas caecigallum]|uniref:LacI family transcriptional regulator n=1 Tax=Sellimonas caecigallum TaxID=2592333 RepID=A0ABS7L978_9FIRM|nr:LacI family DNA-binding transcriptional regulator [Sellimonas caecigallum]MBY0759654.1 LacI family transcriptional regulator [Sellimonas caecigallum]